MGKIYLLETNLYTKEGEHVYKLGRTDQIGLKRFPGYPPEYEIILLIECEDSKKKEAELIKLFKQKYILCTHREYFVGNKINMIEDIFKAIHPCDKLKEAFHQFKLNRKKKIKERLSQPFINTNKCELLPVMLDRSNIRIPSPDSFK